MQLTVGQLVNNPGYQSLKKDKRRKKIEKNHQRKNQVIAEKFRVFRNRTWLVMRKGSTIGCISFSNRFIEVGTPRLNLKTVSTRGYIALFALSLSVWIALEKEPLIENATPR